LEKSLRPPANPLAIFAVKKKIKPPRTQRKNRRRKATQRKPIYLSNLSFTLDSHKLDVATDIISKAGKLKIKKINTF
jgi:hypothetical protein